MKIKIKEREYILTRDDRNWKLQTPKVVIDKKTKNEKPGYVNTYYRCFKHTLQAILDQEVGRCESLVEVIQLIKDFQPELKDQIEDSKV